MSRIRVYWLIPILASACPQQLGNRCGPDLPPCPSGTACVDELCREQATGGGVAAGGRAGGLAAGGSAGGQSGGIAGGEAGGSSLAGGAAGGGASGGIGGGDAGGATAGGSSGGIGGGVTGCVPGCAEFEECVGASCLARYSGIAVAAPGRANRPVAVSASLVQIGGRLGNPPPRLELDALLSGATPTRVSDSLLQLLDGGYALTNPLPVPREGTWAITVLWPDAGPSGTAQTVVDLSGPALRVTWPAAPGFGTDGGLDFRDPSDPSTGPFSWRHSSIVPVRIESSSLDLVDSSVKVGLGGAPFVGALVGCTPDGGSPDGGFCRIANIPLRLGVLEGLRGSMVVRASASDDLTNETDVDAGSLAVSRWAFSFDGGSSVNGFSVASRALVIPKTGSSVVLSLRLNGGPPYSVSTLYPPVRNAVIAANTVYVLEYDANSLASQGEAFDLALTNARIWASDAVRSGIQTAGPILAIRGSSDSVASAFKLGVVWSVFDNGSRIDFGTSANAPSSTSDPFSAVGRGFKVAATDGTSLFTFSGSSSSSFAGLEVSQTLALPTPFASVTHLVGVTSGVVGLGIGMGLNRSFAATPAAFTPWAAQAAETFGPPVAGSGTLYFSRQYGSFSVVCRTAEAAGSFVCAQANLQDQTSGVALGAGDTLYTVVTRAPSNTTLLQVRVASTLALRYEIPLPGVTGACLSLTPTCVDGNPVIGCVDTVGRLVFVSTDARGIDTTADWPMEGHDPAKTFNTATDLTPYACP